MEYNINSGVKVKLNKVTPRNLKYLKNLGFWDTDKTAEKFTGDLFRLYIDEDKRDELKDLLKTIFIINDNELEKLDFEELDLAEVMRGFFDFFAQLTKPLLKSIGLEKISPNLS